MEALRGGGKRGRMNSKGVPKCQMKYEEAIVKETQRESGFLFLSFFSCIFFSLPSPVLILKDNSLLPRKLRYLENKESCH